MALNKVLTGSPLAFALEELYWNHLEYYSAHDCGAIDLRKDMLCSVLIQCKTGEPLFLCLLVVCSHVVKDQLTSEDSTFPFSAQKCDEFLRVVQDCKGML